MMPQLGAKKLEDSLFSLELVVEKVYIPHTPCRFPAIAFRLLDYPTIVIKHVEDDLGKAIRSKISFDPYYQLPDQFTELKDRHGNFMVKKGKSCLLKIPLETLKQHLANTPLYVMIIDLFPEVPKLVGNSSVPLNNLMDSICNDIAKVGPTVPSVHGDKGLFKLYNLMGNEIGYFLLGFRLLCLGPSLIPHLPESILLNQRSNGKTVKEDRSVNEMVQRHENQPEETDDTDEPSVELRNSACMTDPEKHDVLLQTVEMLDKAVHVVVSDSDSHVQSRKQYQKELNSISTQTEKRKKMKESQNAQQKWVELVGQQVKENEDVIIGNIICPPPLFYNSNASPRIRVNRQNLYQGRDEMSTDDLSDIHSFDGQGFDKFRVPKGENMPQEHSHAYQARHIQEEKHFKYPVLPTPQARNGETVHGLKVAPNSGTVFPLLTALIQELSYIQNPQLLLNISNRMQEESLKISKTGPENVEETKQKQTKEMLSPSVVTAIAAALTKKLENSKENKNIDQSEQPLKQQNSQPSAAAKSTQKKNLQNQKLSTKHFPKKSKLVYGLTNTQRLRLQKTNPKWLKEVEEVVAEVKLKKQLPKKEVEVEELSSTMFSDTLTEVRRLAERELNTTACEDTLLNVTSNAEVLPEPSAKLKDTNQKPQKKERNVDSSTRKLTQDETVGISPSLRSLHRSPSPKQRRKPQSHTPQKNENVQSCSDTDELKKRKPVPQARHLKGLSSPKLVEQKFHTADKGNPLHLDLSSKSPSFDEILPSPDSVNSDDSIPLPDDSITDKFEAKIINFPKYLSRDISLPESIDGAANESLNLSGALDDYSPLESTRHSKNLTSNQNESKTHQSTDYDTRQFQSTDEPELQDLDSGEENLSETTDSGRRSVASLRATQKFPFVNPQLSENSPVPSVRRSSNKKDPIAHSYIPSFSQKLETSTSSRSATSKSPEFATKVHNASILRASSQWPCSKEIDHETSKPFMTPRSTSPNSRHPTPQPRKSFLGSLHTDSLSSYMPSDPDNVIVSLSSNSGNYSDDLHLHGIDQSEDLDSSEDRPPRIIPSSKLGYTIN